MEDLRNLQSQMTTEDENSEKKEETKKNPKKRRRGKPKASPKDIFVMDSHPVSKKDDVTIEVSLDYRLACERREWLSAYYADLSDRDMEMHG